MPRVAFGARAKPLREIHLIAVAEANVLLHAAERVAVRGAAVVRHGPRQHAERRRRGLGRSLHAREQPRPLRKRASVAARANEPATPLFVIDDHAPVVEARRKIGHLDVGRRDRRNALEPPAQIVAEIADSPTGKRQPWRAGHPLAELLAQQLERRPRRRRSRAVTRANLR